MSVCDIVCRNYEKKKTGESVTIFFITSILVHLSDHFIICGKEIQQCSNNPAVVFKIK